MNVLSKRGTSRLGACAPFMALSLGGAAALLLLSGLPDSTAFAQGPVQEQAQAPAQEAAKGLDATAPEQAQAQAAESTPVTVPSAESETPLATLNPAPDANAPAGAAPPDVTQSKDESSPEPAAAAADAPATPSSQPEPSAEKASIDTDTTGSIKEDPLAPAETATPAAPAEPTDTAVAPPAEIIAPPTDEAKQATPEKSPLLGLLQTALENLVYSDVKGPHAAETQKIREELAAFYTLHDFAPLWSTDGQATPAAKAVIDRLQHAADDGLPLAFVPDLQGGSDADRVKADLALSEAVIAYGRAASGGRIDPKTISPLIGEKPEVAEPFAILSAVADAGDKAGEVLWGFNPPQKAYQALRQKLAEMRREKAPVAHQPIPSGPELTVGMRDPRVTLIRARFGLDVQQPAAPEDLVYDTRVAAAVAGFQKSAGLPASGVLTTRTIAALSGGQPSRLENEILANMERWRWMPRDMGETYVAVNIPDFTVSVIHGDQLLTRHRVVVGKPDTPTPVFSNKMQYLIVNPYWNVPQSIIRKEFLPKSGGDLSYLAASGWQVSSRHGVLTVRQPPGERNALGRIKFLFPNDYSVYLHDTPSKALFASAKRAFSHGCVRVDQPFSFAEIILNHSWSEQRLKGLIGSGERYINLPTPLPIHIEYFTTYVDETGRLQLRDDLYGYSHKVKVALGLEG
ncbi:L,D-transpeptidase family protein [Methyloferula stellata]|uniref:L,D-transpeptidase family protein n=1 Tax=Methyloferula stellata TaxID=876270 RepID=UPI00036788FC|nr:L,D-transpeptidase family protein [Methyloferula stellata]